MTTPVSQPTFSIGTAARLTGIPVDTLRVWERRYGGMAPARTDTNRRRYTEADIRRLKLVRQLVEQGHAAGTVAHLPEEELRGRLNLHEELIPAEAEPLSASVMLFGELLPFQAGAWADEWPELDLRGSFTAYGEFEKAALESKPAVLVAEWPTLTTERLEALRDLAQRIAAKRVAVVYGFGSRDAQDQARQAGITLVRAPVTATALREACRVAGMTAPAALPLAEAEVPPRRFDTETLGRLAEVSTRLRCECPHHLSDLVLRLCAFEAYSLDCENRTEQDAALHAHLYQATAEARAIMEAALARLVEVEGIELGDSAAAVAESIDNPASA
jgi:DNA-binding transcriptional MerR regulator